MTSTCPPAAACAQDLSLVPDSSTEQRYQHSHGHHGSQHGPRQQHTPQTSTHLQAAAQTMDVYMVFGGSMGQGHQPCNSSCSRTTDSNMALGSSTYHEHQSLLTVRACIRKWQGSCGKPVSEPQSPQMQTFQKSGMHYFHALRRLTEFTLVHPPPV